jgi:hypothetical protein
MIYTPKMKAAVKSIPVPVDFSLDIIEYNFVPPYIGLRFYESQWRHLSENERIKCISYLAKVKKVIESYGVQVTVDPVYDIPGVQKIG